MQAGEDFTYDFVAKFISIRFRDHGLGKGLKRGADKTIEAAWIAVQQMAPQVENYAKLNAPWTDQTGAARQGLAARAYRDGKEVGIIVYHQVSYGIWLEVRWSGKYAIINPTIEAMGPVVMDRFHRLLGRI